MILLKAERDALLKPLAAVTGIVERRSTLPILANVLIEKTEDRLEFLATDLEIQVLAAQTEGLDGASFSLTTSAKKLQDILRALPEKSTVSLEHEANRLTVKAGKSRFHLQTLEAKDFPKLSLPERVNAQVTLACGAFKTLMSRVQYAMAVQDIRYYLNGLLLIAEEHSIRLVATDGHRLAFASMPMELPNMNTSVILPRKIILELLRLLPDSDEPLSIEVFDTQVRFSFGSITIISKVVDGKFPDYQRVIPLDNDKIIMLNRQAFLSALQRAAILANEKVRGVRVMLSENKLSIACTNSDQEEAEEELEIYYSGTAFETGFNINYLLDVLSNLPFETLQIAFGESARSALLTVPDDAGFKYVVMPMRI